MPGQDKRQSDAPAPQPQDALADGGDAEELATDVADTPEAEGAPPPATPGHTVSTRPVDDYDEDEAPDEAGAAEFPQTATARDPDLD